MDLTRTLYGEIAEIVRVETRFLRHYWAEVVDTEDALSKGRVKVTIPTLGWDTPAKGAWCNPRDRHSMVVPKVGEYVEVYFLEGNENKPVYLGQVAEFEGQTPSKYTDPETVVLYENPVTGVSVLYKESEGVADISFETVNVDSEALNLNGDSKAFVTYAELDTALQSLVSAINSHVHAGVQTGGGATAPPTAPMSLDISASETQTVKTGG